MFKNAKNYIVIKCKIPVIKSIYPKFVPLEEAGKEFVERKSYNSKETGNQYTGEVKPDGSLVLKLYYSRIVYKVQFATGEGASEIESQDIKYQGN